MSSAPLAKPHRHAFGVVGALLVLISATLFKLWHEPAVSAQATPERRRAEPVVRAPEPVTSVAAATAVPPLPPLLSGTGLYLAGRPLAIAPNHLRFAPRYPLWTDGARKARFIRIPDGAAIDASDPDHFVFPRGTRFWKEFGFGGRRIETRYIERLADGSFRYATYRWNAAGTDAELVSPSGLPYAAEIASGVFHDLPSESDCRACHEGRLTPVLGFNTLQLATKAAALERPDAPAEGHEIDLAELVRRSLLVNLPATLLADPPQIHAPTATSRAALGYLFANCAHCHNAEGPLRTLGLDFDQPIASQDGYERVERTAVGRPSHFRAANGADLRIAPGRAEASTVLLRMRARDGVTQMPPLGTKLVDLAAVDLVSRFIQQDLSPTSHPIPGGSS